MTDNTIETTDHDAGPPPLHCTPHSFLVPVLLDGRRWVMVPPGDAITQHLVGTEPGAGRHGQV